MSVKKESQQNYERLSAAVKKTVVEWDPIGVLADGSWPDDEYAPYIPSICSILIHSSEISTLQSKLNAIVELKMGLPPQHSRNAVFAEKLWKLRGPLSIETALPQAS